jgi:hypothetical protein
MLKQHFEHPPASSNKFHPFKVIWNSISTVFGLQPTNQDDLQAFKALTKKQLVSRVWTYQYRKWWDSQPVKVDKSSGPPTLRDWYPSQYPAPSRQLPHYLHKDHPCLAAHRARLRFGRALLLYYMCSLQFPDAPSPYCQHCPSGSTLQENETVRHIICKCTCYTDERLTCQREMSVALRNAPARVILDITDDPTLILDPEIFFRHQDKKVRKHLNQLLSISGKLIEAVYEKRKF